VGLLLASSAARADDGHTTVTTDVLVYTDTDRVMVGSPQVAAHHDLDEDGGEVSARVSLDAITAASVDVISNATYRFSELRTEVELAVSKSLGETLPSLSYRYSHEPDYVSHGFTGGLQVDLAGGDTTLSGDYGLVFDSIGRSGTPRSNFSESMQSYSGELGVTQVVDRQTLVRAVYTLTGQFGYMEKPYRSVPIFSEMDLQALADLGTTLNLENFDEYRLPFKPAEEVPGQRYRHALAGRVLRFVDAIDASLRADYRLYGDSWGVWGHTAELALAKRLGKQFQLDSWTRFHYQNGADFWRRAYGVTQADAIPSLRTMDRSLSPYWQSTLGSRLQWTHHSWQIYLQAALMYTSYLDHLLIQSRTALITQGGLRWSF
jgi:hypothetical protein